MSCFSCFSRNKHSLEENSPAPRPVWRKSQERTRVVKCDFEKTALWADDEPETMEITSMEKEVEISVSQTEYASDSEEEYLEVEVEKHVLERRGAAFVKQKSRKDQQPIGVHNTGDELQLRYKNQQMIAAMTNAKDKVVAENNEKTRQRKWEQDRYGSS